MGHFITVGSLLFLLSFSVFATPIYKWVDAQGVTHFGSEPPNNQGAENISRQTYQPKPVASSGPKVDSLDNSKTQAEIDREVRQQVAEEAAALKAYCTEARYNLAQLENNPRVLAEVDGKTTRLSEEQRQARITELKTSINERCTTYK